MATTKVSGELVDLRGGLPDFSLGATNTVSYLNAGGGNQYNFNGAYGLYGVVNGTYVLSSVSSSHPIAILNNGKTSLISYTGAVNEGSQTGPDGNTYTYYSGDVTITVSGNFDVVSYACKVHGYMGGQNNLIYTNLHSELGLKIPTGTNNNRPATDVAGMIRNNTNESSDSSASCEEYYNGTAWKKINNVAIPPPLAFKTIIYNGNGTSQSITGLGFQPDLVWIKQRGGTNPNGLWDSTRGAGKLLVSNTDAAESGNAGDLMGSFDADGFQVNRQYLTNTAYDNTNYGIGSAAQYVAWCWKANGGTTTIGSGTGGVSNVTNQVNSDAGFSITKWNEGSSSTSTVTHGLSQAPDLVITKKLNAAQSWMVWHEALSGTQYLRLQETNAVATSSSFFTAVPDSTSVYLGGFQTESTSNTRIMYAFHSVAGYSKIGSYSGGSTGSGNVITTGFQPDWIMIKRTDTADDWTIMDSVRGDGASSRRLIANTSEAEKTATSIWYPTSTGFYFSGTGNSYNASGGTYIYMAFLTA